MSNKSTYTVLWETDTPFKNQYSIELNDSIDNYDEIICYGSANRGGNDRVNVKSTYPVISGTIHLVGPYTLNTWQSTNYYMLNNGTQMYLSGTSGYIDVSYYWGMQNGGTAFEANRYTTARNADVHPYKIVGVKHGNTDKIWETTGNTYETNITLDEPITHFNKLVIYSSGTEDSAYGVHLAKNVYTVQPSIVNGCDTWGYSPWALNFKCNYLLGCSLKLSGNSGHVGSSYYWGIGNNNATWAAGKWTTTAAPRMLQPYVIYGLDRCPTYKFKAIPSLGGTVSSNINPGYSGDIATITVIPNGAEWRQSALNITGAELTGNDFMFANSNVTAQAEFEHSKNLTLENGDHGVLSADKMSGFSGDVVTVDATTDEGWYLSAIALTGAEATGFKFMFTGSDVTALGEYTDVGFPITYESTEGGSLEGDPVFIPGSTGITLNSVYDTYYRLSGYDVTGGTITDGVLVADGPCTAKAVYKVNYFTATGNFEKGSNVNCRGNDVGGNVWRYLNVPENYALYQNHTGDIPSSWYETSNRWKPNDVSSYSITLNTKMTFTANNGYQTAKCTAVSMIGETQTASQTYTESYVTNVNPTNKTWTYNKTVTTTTQNVNYGVSAKLAAYHWQSRNIHRYATATYIATGTTGTWTATGIAP